jgi:hypothetical protein
LEWLDTRQVPSLVAGLDEPVVAWSEQHFELDGSWVGEGDWREVEQRQLESIRSNLEPVTGLRWWWPEP